MSGISTHVLNMSNGLPARGIPVVLAVQTSPGHWRQIGAGRTNDDGRIDTFLAKGVRMQPGTFRLTFDVTVYFRSQKITSLYPEVTVTFTVRDAAEHYHIPLLLGPFGYTTYRGS